MNTFTKTRARTWAIGLIALAQLPAVSIAGQNWLNTVTCTDTIGTRYIVKTTADRGAIPQINVRQPFQGQGALITDYGRNTQIPGMSSLETGTDITLSRTNNFLLFFVELKAADGQTIVRRYEDGRGELLQFIHTAKALSSSPNASAASGSWSTSKLDCENM